MKHLLIILSFLLLSSPVIGQETGVLYQYETLEFRPSSEDDLKNLDNIDEAFQATLENKILEKTKWS